MGQSDFNQFMRLRNQLTCSQDNVGGKQNLAPIQLPALSEHMVVYLKLAHREADVVDRPYEGFA